MPVWWSVLVPSKLLQGDTRRRERWDILYEEPATGRTLEGQSLLEEYDLRYVSLLAPALEWFLTAI